MRNTLQSGEFEEIGITSSLIYIKFVQASGNPLTSPSPERATLINSSGVEIGTESNLLYIQGI